MSDWKITGKTTNLSSVGHALTMGLYPESSDYKVEHKDTGETKTVTAFSERHAGEKISEGKFNE